MKPCFYPVIPAKAGIQMAANAVRFASGRDMSTYAMGHGRLPRLSESGFAGFSGFRFARLSLFAVAGNLANENRGERLPLKDKLAES